MKLHIYDFKGGTSSFLSSMGVGLHHSGVEVSGRESDIGHADDNDIFMGFHAASCKAFEQYAGARLPAPPVTPMKGAFRRRSVA